MKALFFIFLAIIFISVFFAPSKEEKKAQAASFPTSNITYAEITQEVGCESRYNDDKKEHIFNSKYKNKWMTWKGEAVLSKADKADLNMDDKGISDLSIKFSDENAGYDLENEQVITVKFVMRNMGGCFLPFSGDMASILN